MRRHYGDTAARIARAGLHHRVEIALAVRLIPEGMVALIDVLTNHLARKYGGHSVTPRGSMYVRGRLEDEIPYWRLLNSKDCVISRKRFMPNREQRKGLNLEDRQLFTDSRNRVHIVDCMEKVFYF